MNFRCFNCYATENLYRAPQSTEMRNYWLDLFPDDGGPEIFTQSFRICAEHFDNKFILANGQLSSKAVPTKFLVHNVWCEVDEYNSDDSDDTSTFNTTTINPTPSPMRIPPQPPEMLMNEPWLTKQTAQNQTILKTGPPPTQLTTVDKFSSVARVQSAQTNVVHPSILPESNRQTFIQTPTGIIRISPSVSTLSNITQRVVNRPFPGANSQLIPNQQIVIVSPPRPPSTMSPQVSHLSLGSGQIQIPAGHTIQLASHIPSSGIVGIVNPFQTAGHALTSTNTINQPIVISSPLNSSQAPTSISTAIANSTSPVQPKIPASISTAIANSMSPVQPKIPASISTAIANSTSPVQPKIPASISTAIANSTLPVQPKTGPKTPQKTTEMQNFLQGMQSTPLQSTKDRIVAATKLQQAFIESSEKILQAKQKAASESKIKSEQEELKTSTDQSKPSPKSFEQKKPANEPKPTPKSFDPSTTDLEELKSPPSTSFKTIDVAEQAATSKAISPEAKPSIVEATSELQTAEETNAKQQTAEETNAKTMLAADVLSQPNRKRRTRKTKTLTIHEPKQLRRTRREENAASESQPTGSASDSKLRAALLRSEKVAPPSQLKRRKQCKIAVVLLKRQKLEPAIKRENKRSKVKQRRKSVSFASTVSTTRKMVKYNNKMIKAEVAITASPPALARRKLFQLLEDDEPVVENRNDNGDIVSKEISAEVQPSLPTQSIPSFKSALISSPVPSQGPLRTELTPSSNSLSGLSPKSPMKLSLRSSPKLSRESDSELLAKSSRELSAKSTTELSAKSTPELSAKSTPELSAKSTPELSAKSTPELSAKLTSELSAKSTSELSAKLTPELSAQSTSELSAQSTRELSPKSTPELPAKSIQELPLKSAPKRLPQLAPKPSLKSTSLKQSKTMLPPKSPKVTPIKSSDSTNNTISTVATLTSNTSSSSITSSFTISPLASPSIRSILRNSPNTSSASIGDLTENNQLCQVSQLQSEISSRKGVHTIDLLPVSERLKFYKAEFKRVKSKKTALMTQVDKYTDRFNKLRNYLERLAEAGLIMKRTETN